ncbi:MAG: RtcB family protein, partial [Phycisphaerae bacterium]|nr:RtcB family protein [Phycisphaerae bacterium]
SWATRCSARWRRGSSRRRLMRRPTRLRSGLGYAVWGEDIDEPAHQQMRNACRLPVTVAAALMPDAHVGYGLPIGGVLATDNAVIPYAVGVDIACRVKLTVFDLPPEELERRPARFESILERDTLFGVGGAWRGQRPAHAVMDEDWGVTPFTAGLKDLAWSQLGTSGSGNHFVEFGELELLAGNPLGLEARRYLGVVSHSGSRGSGARTCDYYSRVARELHPHLPKELSYLAWLPLDGVGAEYWAAMELMGKYASANHDVIHRKLVRSVGADVLFQIENHHNFAWKETHGGRELIVHRKGATPAGRGVLGYIPGSMTAPGYLVEGLGDPASLDSASHGAGRRMSRVKARETTRWSHLRAYLAERGVRLISAGLDESPHAYKDIDAVMRAQAGLVRPVARFQPRLVKMAPEGEKPED